MMRIEEYAVGNRGVGRSRSRQVAYVVAVEDIELGELMVEASVRAYWVFCLRSVCIL